jgi:FemAB-related protein (PEP-CTERM system-associated)
VTVDKRRPFDRPIVQSFRSSTVTASRAPGRRAMAGAPGRRRTRRTAPGSAKNLSAGNRRYRVRSAGGIFGRSERHRMTTISSPQTSVDGRLAQEMKQTLYYTPAWLDLVTRLYGYSPIALTATNASGQVTGFLPLCLIQSPLTGHRLVSLPFSDYCPLLAADEASANDLVDQAILLAQEKRVRYLELRTGVNDVLAKRTDLVAGNLYVRWLTPLCADTDTIWRSIHKSVQQRVKKAQRRHVRVQMAESRESMEHYYRLHLLTRSKKHGMPAQSRRYFFGLWDTFAPSGALQLWLAEHEGIVVAASICLASGSTVRLAYNASDQHYLYLAPNHLLIWTTISWACANGYSIFDMGRTARDNNGLMDFKRRWGAIMEPLAYYYYPRTAGLAATSERSWKYRLLTGCWSRLPLQVAAPLGDYLYKHLG